MLFLKQINQNLNNNFLYNKYINQNIYVVMEMAILGINVCFTNLFNLNILRKSNKHK